MGNQFKASLKKVRIAPRKARLVADLIRNKHVQEAIETLRFTNKKAAPLFTKLINSAVANVLHSATVDVDSLVVETVFVDEGPTIKRFLPRAQGRATPIRKRTSHITLKLKEI